MLTDAQLIAVASSDPAAFRELYERHARRIYGFHLRRCRDADGAHDLTAETFAQAWLGRRDFATRQTDPLLHGSTASHERSAASVRKRSLSEARARGSAFSSCSTDRPRPSSPTRRGSPSRRRRAASSCLAQREAIQLHVVDDLSFEEVGRRVGTSTGSARIAPIVASRPFVNACRKPGGQHRDEPDQSLVRLAALGDALEQGAAGRSRSTARRADARRAIAPEHAGDRDRRRSPADRGAGYRDRSPRR